LAQAPLLRAAKVIVKVDEAISTPAYAAPARGVRTTQACEPPFRKNCCTA
jgi:hypothetical protein